MKHFPLEKLWELLFGFFCTAIGVLIIFSLIVKKPTIRYTLSGKNDNELIINREIEWCMDDEIHLDRSVTYWDAIHMVDSLNKTIRK